MSPGGSLRGEVGVFYILEIKNVLYHLHKGGLHMYFILYKACYKAYRHDLSSSCATVDAVGFYDTKVSYFLLTALVFCLCKQ